MIWGGIIDCDGIFSGPPEVNRKEVPKLSLKPDRAPPAAGPNLLYWRMKGGLILTSVLGPAELVALAESRDNHGGSANRAVLRRHVPIGAEAWAASEKGPWKPLADLPREWPIKQEAVNGSP